MVSLIRECHAELVRAAKAAWTKPLKNAPAVAGEGEGVDGVVGRGGVGGGEGGGGGGGGGGGEHLHLLCVHCGVPERGGVHLARGRRVWV